MSADSVLTGTLAFLAPVSLAVLVLSLSGGLKKRRRRINASLRYWRGKPS